MTKGSMETAFRPSLSVDQTEKNLSILIVRGPIHNSALNRAIVRLDERFRNYCDVYPHGLWSPGLVLTNEMRASTELYLPMAEIRSAFRHFFSAALRYPLSEESNPFQTASNWLDLLQRLRLSQDSVNPAVLLKKLVTNESERISFLFSTLLPHHHGGSFLRYPEQLLYLEGWLRRRKNLLSSELRVLDAACGTGEGTYDLAGLLLKCGIPPHLQQIHGSSLEALEVFTAAHGSFPHDPERQKHFRTFVEPLFAARATGNMLFFQDNIMRVPAQGEKPYDIILCNGLLGGPFLHDPEMIETSVAALAKRLTSGGTILAADRFHGGWKKENPPARIVEIMQRIGLEVHHGVYGLAAGKKDA
ncbi:MAG: chemotaxis protein CheR [Deltaproteobacteria bacterium]|nr:chemotaxis protein CheR [Deltaproteobacteria bacterium]TLN01687.1 MAG: chemotaxis protein CheR [bacterium]